MLTDDALEGFHERPEPLLTHRRDAVVPVAPLAEEGMSSALDGIRAQFPVEPDLLAGGTQQSHEGMSHRDEEQQTVPPLGVVNVGCAFRPIVITRIGAS